MTTTMPKRTKSMTSNVNVNNEYDWENDMSKVSNEKPMNNNNHIYNRNYKKKNNKRKQHRGSHFSRNNNASSMVSKHDETIYANGVSDRRFDIFNPTVAPSSSSSSSSPSSMDADSRATLLLTIPSAPAPAPETRSSSNKASNFLATFLMNSTALMASNGIAATTLTAIANYGAMYLNDSSNNGNIMNIITTGVRVERDGGGSGGIMPNAATQTNLIGMSDISLMESAVNSVNAAAAMGGNLSMTSSARNLSIFSSTSSDAVVDATTTTYGILQQSAVNGDISFNDSDDMLIDDAAAAEYIFDRTDVRIIFITLYTLVFCCCFFGNLLVILVVTLSRRLRSITNFFLANLALADFCVGLFCVMQNLSIYLIDSWVFGEFLCRMYQFVHSLSYTASIFILVVICMERYFAIVHPITCKQILTAARLRMVILTVWITSAVYSTPKFVFSKTIKNIHNEDGQEEEICVLDRKMFNSKLLDMINFVLLYVIPLLVMTVLYSKIAIALWRSSRGLSHQIAQQQQHDNNSMNLHNSMYHHHQQAHNHSHHQNQNQHPHPHPHPHKHQLHPHQQNPPDTPISMASSTGSGLLSRKQSSKYEKRGVSITESQVSLESERPIVSACRKTSFYNHTHQHSHGQQQQQHGQRYVSNQRGAANHISHSSSNVLRARRGVVRMLIIFVLTFALCNLPYHARKMWQYWSRSYRGDSNFNALLTPLTFLVTYFNSGVNPLLYAFLSRNFRKGMKELLLCSWKKGKGKSSSNSSMHHKRVAIQTHSLPTDTTHIGNEQV